MRPTMERVQRYYGNLYTAFVIVLTLLLILFGLSFMAAQTSTVFDALSAGRFRLTPVGFAVICFIFALICPILLTSPWLKRLSNDVQDLAVIFMTFPILGYIMGVFFVMLRSRITITPLYYVANYVLIILVPIAIHRGYNRFIEIVATIAICIVLIVSVVAFGNSPSLALLSRVNNELGTAIQPVHMAQIAVLSLVGFMLLLMPLPRLPCSLRRWVYLVFEIPFWSVALMSVYGSARTPGANIITPLVFVTLAMLVFILGCALCPTGRRSLSNQPS